MVHAAPLARSCREAKTVAVVGHCYTLLAGGEDTDGQYALVEARVPVGDPGTPLHTHHREDETFYLIDGEMTFLLDGREVVAGAGTLVYGPRDMPHAFRNRGDRPARMIVLTTPAGAEAFFAEVGEPLAPGATEAPRPTEEHIARIAAAAPRYGIEIHAPPPVV